MKGFRNCNVYVYNKGIVNCSLGFEDGIIKYIGDDQNMITEPIEIAKNAVILPGFIDQHVHGAAGSDAMDGTKEALKTIANSLATEGTTSFLATTMTQSKSNITSALTAVKDYIASSPEDGARLLGVHLEGPFISEKHVGAQPIEYLDNPSKETFLSYQKASGDNIKIVSLAPESEGADQLIELLSSLGVVASVGHSDAGVECIENAIKFGLKSVTHTFNAQRGVHHREIGVAGSALLFDELYAEAICDTIHLSIPAIKLLIKNKPHDKVILITDAMRAKNLSDGISELGGQKVIVKNGEARLENGALAGSVLRMNDAIKNLVTKCGIDFISAVDFATVNPAKNLGIFDKTGSIEVGKFADFAVLDNDFKVISSIRGGKVVFSIS